MRAIGTSKIKIMAMIIYESLILSLVGGIVGIILMSPTYSMLGLLMGAKEVNFLSFNIPGAIVSAGPGHRICNWNLQWTHTCLPGHQNQSYRCSAI